MAVLAIARPVNSLLTKSPLMNEVMRELLFALFKFMVYYNININLKIKENKIINKELTQYLHSSKLCYLCIKHDVDDEIYNYLTREKKNKH